MREDVYQQTIRICNELYPEKKTTCDKCKKYETHCTCDDDKKRMYSARTNTKD